MAPHGHSKCVGRDQGSGRGAKLRRTGSWVLGSSRVWTVRSREGQSALGSGGEVICCQRRGCGGAMELEEGSDGLGQQGGEWERGRWLVVHKSTDNLKPPFRTKIIFLPKLKFNNPSKLGDWPERVK